jgi:hypothetical protein
MPSEHSTSQQDEKMAFVSHLLLIPTAFVVAVFMLLALTPATELDKGGSGDKAIKYQPNVKVGAAKAPVKLMRSTNQ